MVREIDGELSETRKLLDGSARRVLAHPDNKYHADPRGSQFSQAMVCLCLHDYQFDNIFELFTWETPGVGGVVVVRLGWRVAHTLYHGPRHYVSHSLLTKAGFVNSDGAVNK